MYPLRSSHLLLPAWVVLHAALAPLPAAPQESELDDRIPDFSHCGYRGSSESIPLVAARVLVRDVDGDDGKRIQDAIDRVSSLPADASGFRGAVLLAPGRFEVAGQLKIRTSGVVLRGSGAREDGTTIVATGSDRRALVRVFGKELTGGARGFVTTVADSRVPVGARELTVVELGDLRSGDDVFVERPSTKEWIEALGMDTFGVGWRPGTRDLRWDRRVERIDGDRITLDAPITTALESRYGGGRVRRYRWPGRIDRVGVENLRLLSKADASQPLSEDHSWVGVTFECCQDAWVRQVRFEGFSGGAVFLWETTRRITVEDCLSLEPVSELGGERRRTFSTSGQLNLFFRCVSEQGIRDFTVGHCAAGPNAFVSCSATDTHGESGALGSWASGTLFDNVRIDGGALALENRWSASQGAGWSAANSVLWQVSASEIRCFRPPTAQNWAFGVWAEFRGDGHFEDRNRFAEPRSLFLAQLEKRLGPEAARRRGPIVRYPRGSTNPRLDEVDGMVRSSDHRAPTVRDLIDTASERRPIPADPEGIPTLDSREGSQDRAPQESPQRERLRIENGWLTISGRLARGRVFTPQWWRGNTRPREAPSFGPAVTRFVPGREGTGFTDDLDEVGEILERGGYAALEHHYGLWYDRRRDDHERVRRADGDVAAPFYELPFARSGSGRAFDGLSRYDLTRYSTWYWSRLSAFADVCDRRGLILLHQNYFQHHLLEAGAHWTDFPWRSANNINETGFPEPPPYAGDKRIFQAHLFYDPTHPVRRALHRAYIRKCLESFADNSNVIQLTSAEFTGPLAFVEFWIDTIVEWEEETGRDAIVALSATKDVQDAILAQPTRSGAVSVIDIRYWWYEDDGDLYAPPGGRNLSPRQFARQLRPGRSSSSATIRALREYRTRFPEKAVLYNVPSPVDPWAVLLGGGSLPAMDSLPPWLSSAIPALRPDASLVASGEAWALSDGTARALILVGQGKAATLDLTRWSGPLVLRTLRHETGEEESRVAVDGGRPLEIPKAEGGARLFWLSRG